MSAVARSVIPGRQRWDVGVVLGRPQAAELLEIRLNSSPSIVMTVANPVTGRLLVHHDTSVSSDEVARIVRDAVASTTRRIGAAPMRPVRPRDAAATAALAGAAAIALAHKASTPTAPLVRLGAVATVTVIVVRRAWRKTRRRQRDPGAAPRNPLRRIVGPDLRRMNLATTLSALGQVAEMSIYLLLGWSFLVLTKGPSGALTRLGVPTVAGQVWLLTGTTALVSAGAAVLSYLATTQWRELAQSVQHRWRMRTYAHVQQVGLRHLEGERTTRLARVLTDDIDQLGRFFAGGAGDLVQLGTCFLLLVPGFVLLAPNLAWIVFLPVPFIAWLSFVHQERTTRDYADSGERGSLLNSQLVNNLEASATVKSFGGEQHEIARIGRLSDDYRRSNRRVDRRATGYAQGVRACVMVSMSGIALAGGLGVLRGGLPYGVYNALTGLPYVLLGRLPTLGNAVDQYQQTVSALRRVLDLAELPVEPDGRGRRLAAAHVRGEVVFDRVSFAYPGRPPVLRDLSLRIPAGQTTGIVGVTGAGKTTIAKLLMRLENVDSGRVLLDGRDIRDIRLRHLRRAISFVGQDAFLFDGTVLDNMRYGSFRAGARRVVRAARLAAAHGFVQDMPQRYDTMIGERGTTLSGGQKQRVSLARAFVKDAPIVVLDEATSAVDNETESAIQHALADVARDRTLVIIAHRLSTVRHADWIYVLDKGGIVVEGGTHDDLLARKGMYSSLWNLQIGSGGTKVP